MQVFYERELTFAAIARPSVCRLSVTFVHPTQLLKFSAIFLSHLIRWPTVDIQVKFYGDRPKGTPPSV